MPPPPPIAWARSATGRTHALRASQPGRGRPAAFQTELERRAAGRPFTTLVQAEHASVIQRSIDHQSTALWILGGLVAVAALLVVGQTLARQAFLEASEYPSLHALGGVVEARLAGVGTSHRLRVVGTAVLPTLSEGARLGEGVLATTGLLRLFDPEEFDNPAWYIRLSPDANADVVKEELEEQLGPLYVLPRGEPTDLVNFGRIQSLPLAVGVVLALMAAGTLAHVLVTAVVRRRRELAVLKSVGFTRHQVAFTVMWQAMIFVGAALALGVPLGVAAGRWAWRAFADQLGVVAQPLVPLPAVLFTLAAAALLANVAATLPARAAARTAPALVLRTE